MARAFVTSLLAVLALVPWPGAALQGAPAAVGFICYAAAGSGGGYGGSNLLTSVALDDAGLTASETPIGPGTNTFSIASLALRPGTDLLYAVDSYHLVTLDASGGLATNAAYRLGSGKGTLDTVTYTDVQGLAFDPFSGNLYASVRRNGPDVLVQVDPATGLALKKAPGLGNKDYVVIQPVAALDDVAALAVDPADGQMYGIATDGAGEGHLVKIDRASGATADVGPAGADIQGLSFAQDGRLLGAVGGSSGAVYDIDKTTGAATNPRTLSQGSNYRGLACPTGPVNVVSGKVFWDKDANGQFNADDEGTGGATVRLYRDLDGNGVATKQDELLTTRLTDADGGYGFVIAGKGAFVARVDAKSVPRGHELTTNEDLSARFTDLGLTYNGKNFGHAEHRFVTDQIVVRFQPGTPQSTIDKILDIRGMQVLRYIEGIDTYLCSNPTGKTQTLIHDLLLKPEVVYAEHNYIMQAELHPTDPDYNDPAKVYAPQLIGAEAAWDITTGSPAVTVAVLDSGISWSHPEFAGRIVPGKNIITNTPDTETVHATQDNNGHGTHVAGIIAAAMNNSQGMAGIAPNVKIMPIKVLDSGNGGTAADVAAGLIYATDQGIKIANLSLVMTTYAQVLDDAVQYASGNNPSGNAMLMVVAAGNMGGGIPVWPAAFDQTLAVDATDRTDQLYPASNSNDFVDISAPGVGVWSTCWTSADPNSYASLEGTSMATPHVTGLAALLLSARPDLGLADLRALIQNYAVDLGATGWDPAFGHGRINAGTSLQASGAWGLIAPTPTPIAPPTATPTVMPAPSAPPYAQGVNGAGTTFTDGAGSVWASDKAFTTGTWGYTAGTAKSVTTAVGGTTDDLLYQKYRDAPGEYKYTVPNGAYQVTLKFAEFGVTAANTRVFKVTIEGVVIENALDIYKLAGKAKALDKTYTVTVNDGLLNIAFARNGGNSKYNPVVSAIAVTANGPTPPTLTPTPTITPGGPTVTPMPTATPTATPTVTPTATAYLQRVNCSGTTFTDGAGNPWAADKAFATGSWGYATGSAKSSNTAVNGTTDDLLYQKYRELAGEYKFTVPNGAYQVTLKFAEFSATTATARAMKITMEGVVVENSLSVYGLVGKATALDRTYTVTVTDGLLNIAFAKASGARSTPDISAIEVRSW